MEDTLKTLLEAEMQTEELVAAADVERERMIRAALDDARTVEEKFEARLPEIREAFNRKAEALEAALRILVDPGRD